MHTLGPQVPFGRGNIAGVARGSVSFTFVTPTQVGAHERFNALSVGKRTVCTACEPTAAPHVRLVSWVPTSVGMTNGVGMKNGSG